MGIISSPNLNNTSPTIVVSPVTSSQQNNILAVPFTETVKPGTIIQADLSEIEQSVINITAQSGVGGVVGGVPPREPNLLSTRNSLNQIIRVYGNYTDYHFTYDSYGKVITVYDAIKNITKTILYVNNVFSSVVVT